MKKLLTILNLADSSTPLQVINEIGPEGHKLVWLLAFFLVSGLVVYFFFRKKSSKSLYFKRRKKVTVLLRKDRIYYPRYLELTINNQSTSNIDINSPLLILKGFWYKRKFKLKGTNNQSIYPLYLMKNQSHTLTIDLHRFYGFDRTLKRLPKAKVVVHDVDGQRLGTRQVLLRKTLFNF